MNIHKSIVPLLLVIFWSALSYGQDCVSFTGPIVLNDQIDTVLVFPIYNLDSTDLSTNNQSVCQVNLHFETEYPRDLQISLRSPAGEEISLTGPIVQNSGDVLPGTSWDISFVPIASEAMPDQGYDKQWNNDQGWLSNLFFPTVYTGSYYPFSGGLSNFRMGSAYGEWQLIYKDGLALHNSILHSFSIEFCNPGGIDCKECLADADTLIPTAIPFCENDLDKTIAFSDHMKDPMYLANLSVDYLYTAVIVHNDTVIDYRAVSPNLNLDGLDAGMYSVYGMAYDVDYTMMVPSPDTSFTIDSLRAMMDSLPRIFCGDLTMDALIIDIQAVDTTYVTEVICDGDSLMVGDNVFKVPVMTEVTLMNAFSCDSVIMVDLDVIYNDTIFIDTLLCYGDSLEFDGVWYTDPIDQTFTIASAMLDCDSLVSLTLNFRQENITRIQREICAGDEYMLFDQVLTTSGLYSGRVPGANGCDSIVVLDLSLVTEYIVDTTTTLCVGDTFLIDDQKYYDTGMYSHTFPSTLGCDSTVNLDLTIIQPIRITAIDQRCYGDSVALGDTYYNTTGIFIDTLISAVGCDSIVTLDLLIRPQFESMITETLCFGDSTQSAGKYYSTTGIHVDTIEGRFMCDSIVTLDLTIRPENRTAVSDMICFGSSTMIGDSIYDRTGIYETIMTDINNCDSIVILDLVVMDQISSTVDSMICRGDSVLVGDIYFKEVGNYEVTMLRMGVCDSVVFLNLDIIEPDIVNLPIQRCVGETYDFGGNTYNSPGVYRDTLQSIVTGCDSIVILDLMYFPVYLDTDTQTLCEGDSIFFNDRWIRTSGVYDDSLTTMTYGCDSILRLDITFLSMDDPFEFTETLCYGDSILFGGDYFTAAGIYRDTIETGATCDSIVELDLRFRAEQRAVEEMTICLGDTVAFEGELFTETGEFPFTYSDVNGCDSTIVLDLTVEVCPLQVDIEQTNPTCHGVDDGVIKITVDYGNTGYYYQLHYLSNPEDVIFGSIDEFGGSAIFENLPAGDYFLLIQWTDIPFGDAASEFTIELTNVSGLSIPSSDITNPLCSDTDDGMIDIAITGGEAPYSFLWSDGLDAEMRTGLSAGQYDLTVTDTRGCLDTFDFEIVRPEPIIFEIDNMPPSCTGLVDGSLTFINVQGGTGEYAYNIGFGEQAAPVFTNLGSETYILSVEDANGCIADGLEVIDDPAVFRINAGADVTMDDVGELQLSLSSNSPLGNISWTPSDNLTCADCPSPIADITNTITYRVAADNQFGCTSEDEIIVILDIDRTVDAALAFTPNGDGVNDIFIVHGKSAIAEVKNIEIYARTGTLVWKQESFPVNDANFGWDGTFRGEPLDTQLLGYLAEVLYTDGKVRMFKGQISLIR